jgi:Mce-associated membrane protein
VELAQQAETAAAPSPVPDARSRWWSPRRIPTRWALSGVGLLLVVAVGVLAYLDWHSAAVQTARTESVQAAKESTEAMLSYQESTAAAQLEAAEDRLTGTFRDSFRELVHDVVIPGSEQKHISTVATVPAAASVSASRKHAVVLVFVNQVAIVDNGAPSDTASIVRVTLEKVGGHWLISAFEPI